jgi:small subunit ribosomal protein S8
LLVKKKNVVIPYSKLKEALASTLNRLGFIHGFTVEQIDDVKKQIKIQLKYVNKESAIMSIKRESKPGCRVYASHRIGSKQGKRSQNSIFILTTSKGILSDREASETGVGGEILCTIS